MLQDYADPTSRFRKDLCDSRVQEGQPLLAARLSGVNHDDGRVDTWGVMSLVNPEPLLERLRALREVIKRLGEPLFGEPSCGV